MIVSWIMSNLKWLVIGLGILAVVAFSVHYVKTLEDNAQAESVIVTQQQTIDNKNEQIQTQKEIAVVAEDVIEQRDENIEKIQKDLKAVINDIGPTSDAEADATLKEIIRRLDEVKKLHP